MIPERFATPSAQYFLSVTLYLPPQSPLLFDAVGIEKLLTLTFAFGTFDPLSFY